MRRSLTLTKREERQVQNQLKKLDAAYQAGRVNDMIYKHKRAQLLSNLSRPKAAATAIETNQQGFFQNRRNMEFGPAPVGYWEAQGIRARPSRMVNQSKVRNALLSIHDNEWWNDGFQESLRNSAAVRDPAGQAAQQAANNASYFQQTIMQANSLAATITADTFQNSDIWAEIQASKPVSRALQRLANSVEYTVQRMKAVGLSEEVARDAIRKAAITAGNAMTSQGYDKTRAAEITAMVVRGELSVTGAANQVANDIQQANKAVAALNNNTANTPSAMWRNDLDIHAIGPSGGGVSLKQLQQMRNDLSNELTIENDPVARNELADALSNLDREINARSSGVQQISNAMPLPPGVAPVATQGEGYDPMRNFQANKSTMQQTVAALTRGAPDLWNMVDDIVTIRGNMYFDYNAGTPISISVEGAVSEVTNATNESSIFPSGDFTVYASGKSSIPQLEIVLGGIANALNSPLIPDNEKGYLRYLQQVIGFKIAMLRAQLDDANSVNQAINQINQGNITQNNGDGMPEIIQQQNQTVDGHNHYFMANNYSPLETIVSNGAPMPVNYHNNLHAKGYLNQDPRNDAYWQRMAPAPEPMAKNLHNHWMANGTPLPIGEGYTQNIHNMIHAMGGRNEPPFTSQMGLENPVFVQQNNGLAQQTNAPSQGPPANNPPMNNLPTTNMGLNNFKIQQPAWPPHNDTYLSRYTPKTGNKAFTTLTNAATAMFNNPNAGGVTLERRGFTVRQGKELIPSHGHQNGQRSFLRTEHPDYVPPQNNSTKQANPPSTNLSQLPSIGLPMPPGSILKPIQVGIQPLPSFGLRGSTSTTTSSRSHGGARFVNGMDPRANMRSW